ncbi:GUN4 domain-containing protein [Oculatella sp. LEGE 06141]|nr:GUN4 domain-containing protein [Oculatella sp. LEGE 06141]
MVDAETRYAAYQDKLHQYKQQFMQAIDQQFPLSNSMRAEFQDLQQTLAIKDADIQQIERPILVRKEVEQERQPATTADPAVADPSTTVIQSEPPAVAEPTPQTEAQGGLQHETDPGEQASPEKESDRPSADWANHLNTEKVELHELVDYTPPPGHAEVTSPPASDDLPTQDSLPSDEVNETWDDSEQNWDELDEMVHPESNLGWDDTTTNDDQPQWGDETETSGQLWDDLADTTDHGNGTKETAASIMAAFITNGSTHTERSLDNEPITLPPKPAFEDDDDDDPREHYTRLESLLEAGLWKEADLETMSLMLARTGRIEQGWLDQNAIEDFPCVDLRIMNALWLQYSEGRFGFSVQKQIYDELPHRTALAFGKAVGWWARGLEFFKYYPFLGFARSAPSGHLPARWFWQLSWQESSQMGNFWGGRGGVSRDRWMIALMMRRIEQCNL